MCARARKLVSLGRYNVRVIRMTVEKSVKTVRKTRRRFDIGVCADDSYGRIIRGVRNY